MLNFTDIKVIHRVKTLRFFNYVIIFIDYEKSQLPKIKKDLKNFLSNEEGRIAKKNVKKIALTLAALSAATAGLIKSDSSLAAICSHSFHSIHSVHSAHSAHSDHHRGGWC